MNQAIQFLGGGLLVALALAFAISPPALAQGLLTESKCNEPLLVDYAQPLQGLRPIRAPQRSGQVSFGPSWLRLTTFGSPLQVGASSAVGFSIFAASEKESVKLGWRAVAIEFAVDRTGNLGRKILSHRFTIGAVPGSTNVGRQLRIPVSGKPGLFRLDLVFTNGAGTRRLGHTSRYIRVLPSRANARLGISGSSATPGSRVYFRVENFGTRSVDFGLRYRVERNSGVGWEAPQPPLAPTVFPDVGLHVAAGQAGECQIWQVPGDLATGEYRIQKEVRIGQTPTRSIFGYVDVAPAS